MTVSQVPHLSIYVGLKFRVDDEDNWICTTSSIMTFLGKDHVIFRLPIRVDFHLLKNVSSY